ncbi:MAG: bifunctional 5,10-methylene-tetrahydrofolate dehydrogenase/5,10-methylene-tetrahydrofolate cyclohydrolase, partial [Acidimicrobiia bacterium]|nr:bifunctional 5,10-methylene-tetrahydrofolate dehydrogenase/5,10-methylene-tetrahydrofolate cyclohydrolase [Acidimicrobiia bacterium]
MDGNRLRDEIVAAIRAEIDSLGNPEVCLATVLVGSDKPSQIYVRNKHRKAQEAGMVSRHVELSEDATHGEVTEAVRDLAEDGSVHGILVQLPVPAG